MDETVTTELTGRRQTVHCFGDTKIDEGLMLGIKLNERSELKRVKKCGGVMGDVDLDVFRFR